MKKRKLIDCVGEVVSTIPPLMLGFGIVRVNNKEYHAKTSFNLSLEQESKVKILKIDNDDDALVVEPVFFCSIIKPFAKK